MNNYFLGIIDEERRARTGKRLQKT
jgi:hypothetical protein